MINGAMALTLKLFLGIDVSNCPRLNFDEGVLRGAFCAMQPICHAWS